VQGDVGGFVVARMPLEKVNDIVRKVSIENKREIKIDLVDADGRILFSDYNRKGILKEKSFLWVLVRGLFPSEKQGFFIFQNKETGIKELAAFVREPGYLDFKGNNWSLFIHIPVAAAFKPALELRNQVVLIMFFFAGIGIFIVHIFSRSVSRPLHRLKNAVQEAGRGNLNTVIDIYSRDEIGELAESFREMEKDFKNSTTSIRELQKEVETRKQKEEEIEHLQQRLEFILGANKTGIDIIDSQFNVKYVDAAWKKSLGEFEGKKCYEYFMGRSAMCESCGIVEAMKTKKTVVSEHVLPQEGGRYVQVTTIPFQEKSGEWLYAEINVDITDLKRTERLLREEKNRAQNYLDIAGVIIVALDPEQRIVLINKKGCQILGYEEKELIGNNWFDMVIHNREKDKVKEGFKTLFSGAYESGEYFENNVVTKWGEDRIVAWHNSVLTDEKGDVQYVLSAGEDITDRRWAEEKLKHAKEYIEHVLSVSPSAIFTVDTSRVIKTWNKKAEELTGYSAEEIIGKHCTFFTDFPCKENCGLFDSSVPKPTGRRECSIFTKKGLKKIVAKTADFIKNEKGEIIGGIEIFDDITEQKQSEQELVESKLLFQTLAEVSPVGIFHTDRSGNCIYVNKRWCEMTGLSEDESMMQGWLNSIHPDDADMVVRELNICIQEGISFKLEYRFRQKNGALIWVYGQVAPEYNNIEEIVGFVGTVTDISGYKKFEEELRIKGELLDSTTDSIFMHTTDGQFLYVNEAAYISRGYTKEELMNMNLRDLDTPEFSRLLPDCMSELFEEGKAIFESAHLAKNGTRIPVEINAKLIDSHGKKVVLAVARDITERKKVQDALQKAYDELKEAHKQLIQSEKMVAMGQLAAGISHELNQPLAGIKGFAQIILMEMPDDNPIRPDVLKIIEQVDRMARIIKNVRFFARKSEFAMKEIDIRYPIQDALALWGGQLKLYNIRIKTEFSGSVLKIIGDENQLQQVFVNLLTNARDAIVESKDIVEGGEITIKTELNEDQKRVRVVFKDTGSGISPENLERIFNPFFTTKSPDGGMGMGLAIVYRIIANHNGTIEVESEPGKGSCFIITFPVFGG
ncbi:MAG: PAS domain S-box protein, partial [Candidatus Omnitrophica bacterium]|nr:PAS domain S-box protein [Candidatus Omnitrophota bacterium]